MAGYRLDKQGLWTTPRVAPGGGEPHSYKGVREACALNDYDLIISKMFRGTSVDIEDCLTLIRARGKAFDLKRLEQRYKETSEYDITPEKMMRNLDTLLQRLGRKG